MASLGEDLRQLIITKSSTALGPTYVSDRVHQGTIPQGQGGTFPRIYFERTGREEPLFLDRNRSKYQTTTFDLEAISDDIEHSLTLAQAMWDHVHGFNGTVDPTTAGSRVACVITIEDHDDDYVPKGVASEEGLHVAAMRLSVIEST